MIHPLPHCHRAVLVLGLVLDFIGVSPAQAVDGSWWASTIQDAPSVGFAEVFDARRSRVLGLGGERVYEPRSLPGYRTLNTETFATEFTPGGYATAELATQGTLPGRAYAGAVLDSAADQVWLFGGRSFVLEDPGNPFYSRPHHFARGDLWRLELSPTPVWVPVSVSGPSPAPRWGHAMVFDAAARRALVFGGRDSNGTRFNDLWALDLSGNAPTWSLLASQGAPPSPRAGMTYAFDQVGRRLFLSGGQDSSTTFTETWVLDLSAAPSWTRLTPSGSPPTSPLSACWDLRRGRLVVLDAGAGLHALTVEGASAWTDLTTDRRLVPQVALKERGGTAVYDAARDLLHLPFAGFERLLLIQTRTFGLVAAFDQSPPAAILAPVLTASGARDGVPFASVRLGRDSGLFFGPPTLSLTVLGSTYPVNAPGAYDPVADTLRSTFVLPTGPPFVGASALVNVSWSDPQASHAAGLPTRFPPAPLDMNVSVDSALVYGGAVHLQWSMGDDSLAYQAFGTISRWTAATGWVGKRSTWSDSLRHFRFLDPEISDGLEVRYRLEWEDGRGIPVNAGEVALTVDVNLPNLVAATLVGRRVLLEWRVRSGLPFVATLERQRNGAEWLPHDTLTADPQGRVSFSELSAHGVDLRYRLQFMQGGSVATTAPVLFQVPGFVADFIAMEQPTDGLLLAWQISPADSSFQITLFSSNEDGSDARSIDGPTTLDRARYEFLDRTIPLGVRRQYWLAADDGIATMTSGQVTWSRSTEALALDLALGSRNPADAAVVLRYVVDTRTAAQLQVVDLGGRVWRRVRLDPTTSGTITIPRGELPPGVYWARLDVGTLRRSLRFVVL